MKANPGGTIGPEDVIGRDELIAQLWAILENQSLVLTSERRIGKTCVIRKMKEQARDPALLCFLRDLEGLRSPQEFVEAVYHDIRESLGWTDRARLRFYQLLSKLGGVEVADIKLPQILHHWKSLLWALADDLSESTHKRAVFFWDELPLFIHNVKAASGQASAMEVLDVLRELRQRHGQIRMVFTGSVGLHQVIKDLRRSRYANDPTNDMRTVGVGPLTAEHGCRLASLLMEGEALRCSGDRTEAAARISEAAGHIPYYIHSLIARLKGDAVLVRSAEVGRCFESLLRDPDDPAHFHYYRERLRTYYEPDEERIALAALDALAFADSPLTFPELLNLVRHRIAAAEEEVVRDVVLLLGQDHYLTRRPDDGRYEFRYSIVGKWWRLDRR